MLKFWHRTAGLFAAVFLMLLTITGLLLMQTDTLELDDRHIAHNRVLDWYGIRPAPPPVSFSHGTHWLTQLGERLYFDTRDLGLVDGALIGVAGVGDEILVATTTSLMLLTNSGGIAEMIGAEAGVPTGLTHLGTTADLETVLQDTDAQYVFDPASAKLRRQALDTTVRWSAPRQPPLEILDQLEQDYRGSGLTIERFILDLHTGRLFGALGVLLINVASFLLLLLIASGIALWWLRLSSNQAASSND